MYVLADGGTPAWLLDLIGTNGLNPIVPFIFVLILGLGGLSIPITALALHHRKVAMRHRERMAMIESGMHPDFPVTTAEPGAPTNEGTKQTLEYRAPA